MNPFQTVWPLVGLLLFIFETHGYGFHKRHTKPFDIYSTNEIWSTSDATHKRPKWAKKVNIAYCEFQVWSVEGIVVPLSTKGRNMPPKPYNGFPIGNDLNLDKGHVMALSNGGPDVKYNIVPQSSKWQRTGAWRNLENLIFNYAVSQYTWDPSNIPHASEVERIRSPGSRNLVKYNVTMSKYDKESGEPMKYAGFVQSGENTLYSFTIMAGKEAKWTHNKAPPSQYADTLPSNADKNTDSTTTTVAIVL
eukprot:254059_1